MKFLRRPLLTLLTLALCVGLFLPMPVSAADLYFTAINERIEYLTSDTMPFWSGGVLYVPYTLFDKNLNSTQTDLGITVSYNSRTKTSVTLYNLRQQMLTFDLVSGNCRDELTGEVFPYRAVMRNGKPYLPLEMVCSFFGLRWSYNTLPDFPQSYLVRIMTDDVVLDDATFIGSAGESRSLELLCRTADAGARYGIPTLGVVAVGKEMERTEKFFLLATRVLAENGANVVKSYYCEGFERVAAACPVPIVIAGGKKLPELEALDMAYRAIQEGAHGVDMGRNIFQSDCPAGMAQAIGKVVHEGYTPKQAFEVYESVKNS